MHDRIILFLFLLTAGSLTAQIGVSATVRDPKRKQKSVVVAGTVVNQLAEPIREALVTIKDQQVGTNEHGQFFITVRSLPVEITITHYFHQTYKSLIVRPQTYQDTLFTSLTMSEKSTDIDEVEINASNISLAYDKPYTHVIDYGLREKGMFLLIREKNDYFLRSLDDNNGTIYDLPIPRYPKKFFNDCLGNTHIVYPDSVYQITVWNDTLGLLGGIPKSRFYNVLDPCMASLSQDLVMRSYGPYYQSISYMAVNSSSRQRGLLYKVYDAATIAAVNDYYDRMALTAKNNPMWESYLDREMLLREAEKKQLARNYYYTRPVYAPLLMFGDSAVVFNHNIDSAVVFDVHGKFCREFAITHHYSHGWAEEIIFDEEQTRMYAKCTRNGMVSLVQFDPITGKIGKEIKLEGHIYAWKIQVKGNYVYYLYHHYGDVSINYIYKHRIDDPAH